MGLPVFLITAYANVLRQAFGGAYALAFMSWSGIRTLIHVDYSAVQNGVGLMLPISVGRSSNITGNCVMWLEYLPFITSNRDCAADNRTTGSRMHLLRKYRRIVGALRQ